MPSRWTGRRQSTNVQDRRRMGGGGAAIGGAGGVGVLAIVVIGYFLGVDLTPLLGGQGGVSAGTGEVTAADEAAAELTSAYLASTEDVWTEVYPDQVGQAYQAPPLTLFKGSVQSGCGGASASTGPFYCPVDSTVYLDTDFFVVMERQLGAGGDFAQAYVVAHEVGHHIQNLLGILDETNRVRARASEAEANAVSVRTELQADCLAGVWARFEGERFGAISREDVAEAMNAAEQIGDDELQREAGQAVRPDSFTHGSSEQRQRWFLTGLESGEVAACNTFEADQL